MTGSFLSGAMSGEFGKRFGGIARSSARAEQTWPRLGMHNPCTARAQDVHRIFEKFPNVTTEFAQPHVQGGSFERHDHEILRKTFPLACLRYVGRRNHEFGNFGAGF